MNGSPVGVRSSFLQSMEPPYLSSKQQGGSADGVLSSAKSPPVCAEELKVSLEDKFEELESGKEGDFHPVGLGTIRKGYCMGRRKKTIDKDDLSEDYCFVCKDGGEIRVCDFKDCLKSYHPHCLEKDESFLESDERWTCDWHSCYNCHKSSTFRCFCCPYSSCRTCFGGSGLVKVKGAKGFCTNCLRLTKLIEENVDVDSDGEMVDFTDTDTYEFLFKDYWEIVKEKERLTLANLQAADDLLKRGEVFKNLSDSDENFEEQEEVEGSDNACCDEVMSSKDFMRKQNRMAIVKEKSKLKKKTYVGWASKELIDFLVSLGKDTQQPLGQHDVYEIVKDYIQSNNLLHHDKKKKKHVFCDARLLSLFRRKKVNFFKVYSLLEKHFAENDDSDDESFSLEEDDYAKSAKKQRMDKSSSNQNTEKRHFLEHALQPPKQCFAAITEANIKLIYLKRSLIVELLKDPKTFESKVVGCFVRRKSDPKDNYGQGPLPRMYQLNQITGGVIKAAEEYKLGDMNTNIILCVSNYCKVVQISMLSDDNFEEEECEDLRRLVKEGLFKRPNIDELKEKIRAVHEDMVKHSVKKELLKLEKLIERANEKGWRKELFDYIERKKLLNKPEEIMRLIKELPDVTVDIEAEATEGANSHVPAKNVTKLNKAEVQGGIQSLKTSVIDATKQIIFEDKREDVPRISLGDAANPDSIITEEKHEDADPNSSLMDATNSDKRIAEEKIEGCDSSAIKVNVDTVVIEIDDEVEANGKGSDDVHIIDLDVASENPVVENAGSLEKIWNYLDPSGNVQGPFSIRTLEYWMEEGFFDEDFRIWKDSQSQENAIPLGVALALLQ
ncbi:uncharacterized protein At5g08430 [Dendrobium catenatum]|uniref:uncharacterized protein At5g08430 n=1 Tax=Dendrobium catenatum TaxID=906689 RepID=UPI00109EE711|nr:uncharacterized protein At5g08430 [Dendrobium catenatum]